MEKEKFNQGVLEKLQELKIKPRARWHFLLKNYAIWISGILALLVGAATFSVIIYLSSYNDFAIRQDIHKSLGEMLLLTLPYFWLIFLGLFMFIVYYNLKHTKTGYRYSVGLIVIVTVGVSVFLGGIFFAAGLGQELDEVFGRSMPLYSEMINPHMDFWSNPEEGRLIGVLVAQDDEDSFILVDKNRQEWIILIKDNNLIVPLLSNQPLRLIGEKKTDNIFEAVKILPMTPGRGFFKRFNSGPRHLTPITNNDDNLRVKIPGEMMSGLKIIETVEVNR